MSPCEGQGGPAIATDGPLASEQAAFAAASGLSGVLGLVAVPLLTDASSERLVTLTLLIAVACGVATWLSNQSRLGSLYRGLPTTDDATDHDLRRVTRTGISSGALGLVFLIALYGVLTRVGWMDEGWATSFGLGLLLGVALGSALSVHELKRAGRATGSELAIRRGAPRWVFAKGQNERRLVLRPVRTTDGLAPGPRGGR
ncbi:hypothetical protein [Nocardioides flavescens]|uniref:Uncharacterized protein n=1 Tax=Nocardioides flavescens TaxID=2691959 RepID=A0A6L7F0L6_9ACTN|nr:hypothetical protein [Nocardioides flavescens]MXG90409.1 hypothetical protein [Nocardioides flavescens]